MTEREIKGWILEIDAQFGVLDVEIDWAERICRCGRGGAALADGAVGRIFLSFPASAHQNDFLTDPHFGTASHSFMFRPPSLLASQIVPTAATDGRRAAESSRGFYIRAEHASFPPHASAPA